MRGAAARLAWAARLRGACSARSRRSLYYTVKTVFLIYLWLPQLRGAEFVYNSFLRPIFQRNAPALEARMVQVRDASATIARAAGLDLGAGGATAHTAEMPETPTVQDVFGPSTTVNAHGRKAN